jgi:hypothetical protein
MGEPGGRIHAASCGRSVGAMREMAAGTYPRRREVELGEDGTVLGDGRANLCIELWKGIALPRVGRVIIAVVVAIVQCARRRSEFSLDQFQPQSQV